jgi:hypothetical protein
VAVTRALGGAELTFVSQSSTAALGPAFGDSARVASAVRLEDAIGPVRAAFSFGGLRETGAVLGATWTPPWGEKPDGATTFAGMSVSWSAHQTAQASLAAELGRTRIIGGDWLKLEAPLLTSAFAAAVRISAAPAPLAGRGVAGALTLSVSQPLRVEEGAFSALLPQSDAWGRAHLAFAPRTISAVPTGREIETRLSYWLWSSNTMIARAELAHRSEPGHRADAEDAVELLVGLRLRN